MPVEQALPESVASRIAAVESPQTPDRHGADPYTIDELLDFFDVPSVSVAVVDDFRVAWTKTWGVADADSGVPATEGTLYQAASISKPVTAVATLRAVQVGGLHLDVDVNDFLRTWKLPAAEAAGDQPVTLRHLLSHTSGLGDGFGLPGYEPGSLLPTLEEILDGRAPSVLPAVRRVRPPLTAFHYSGGGIVLEELVLRDTYGVPLDDLLQSWVFGPLKMTSSTFAQPLPEHLQRTAARAHDSEGRTRNVPWHVYPERAAAGLWTTPGDLALLMCELQVILAGRFEGILNHETARQLVTPVGVGPCALGFMIAPRGEGWYFEHSGDNWGYKAQMTGHLAKGYGAVIMTNGDNGRAVIDEVRQRIERAHSWDALDKPILR